jgi:hypothetical protein
VNQSGEASGGVAIKAFKVSAQMPLKISVSRPFVTSVFDVQAPL